LINAEYSSPSRYLNQKTGFFKKPVFLNVPAIPDDEDDVGGLDV